MRCYNIGTTQKKELYLYIKEIDFISLIWYGKLWGITIFTCKDIETIDFIASSIIICYCNYSF